MEIDTLLIKSHSKDFANSKVLSKLLARTPLEELEFRNCRGFQAEPKVRERAWKWQLWGSA